jgi:hypothetical protein
VSNLCIIELYANNLTRKNTFQTGTGDFVGCEFTLAESGPRDFTLSFSDYQDIETSDIIKIKLHESANYFFMGVVREIPIEGSTTKKCEYRGYGLSDYLTRLNTTSKSYSSQTISAILTDLLDNIIIPSTPITKNVGKLNPPAITVTSLVANYTNIANALDALLKIARSSGDYVYGVDADGDFFFDERTTDLQVTLTVGTLGDYGTPFYNPEDIGEPVSKVFLKDKDGNYITTITDTSVSEIKEIELTAPDISNADAALWAAGVLAREAIITRRATIEWDIEDPPTLLKADGTLRIISNIPPYVLSPEYSEHYGDGNYGDGLYGGAGYFGYNIDDTLEVKEVTYMINDTRKTRVIELGELPIDLTEDIVKTNKKIADLRVSLGV